MAPNFIPQGFAFRLDTFPLVPAVTACQSPGATASLLKVGPKVNKTPFSFIPLTQERPAGIFRKIFTKH